MNRFLTRQPVLDGEHRVVGHELKLRAHVPVAVIPGAESLQQMQDEMLIASVIDLDFQRVLGDRLVFLGIAPATLRNPMLEQLPQGKTVLAVEPSGPDDIAIHLAARLGIPLALDDVDGSAEYFPLLLGACHFVRLDITRYDALVLADRAARLRARGVPHLIARNVETEEDWQACRKLPFHLFQGYYFTRVQAGAARAIDSSRVRIMELLNLVMNRAEIARIEAGFKLDAGLAYRLLRFINSPANGLRQPVESIAHALMLLGHDQLYRWLSLLLFTQGKSPPRALSVLRNALIRANFTERLGRDKLAPAQQGGLFLVGILSMLDALLNLPMAEAIAPLRLPDAVTAALLRREGCYAPYLNLALACENFDQDEIARLATEVGLDADAVNLAHVQALIWSEELEI